VSDQSALDPRQRHCDPDSRVYQNVGKIIGRLGGGAFAFWNAAKLLPGYDKYRYENAMRDLTVYEPRERGEDRLHAPARKVLRIILGPAPGDPECAKWWKARLVSVKADRERGLPIEWVESPPVPLPEDKPAEPKKPAWKPRKKRAR
jgi:hypothetical protein